MRAITLSSLMVLALSAAMAADLDVRHIYLTNDVSAARSSVAPLRWYQGESVVLDLWAVRGTNAVDLSGVGMSVRWDAVPQTATNPAYIATNGTIVSAAGGHVRFTLAPEYSSLPAGTYRSFVRAYQGSTYVGTLHASEAQVSFAAALGITYAGPWSNVVTVLPSDVLRTSMLDPVTLAMSNGVLTVLPGASTEDAVARAQIAVLQTQKVDRVDTNGWEVGSHASLSTMADLANSNAATLAAAQAYTAAATGTLAGVLRGETAEATGTVATALRGDITAATNANYASLTNWVAAQGYGTGGGGITQLVATADAAGVPSQLSAVKWGIGTNTTGLGGGADYVLPTALTAMSYSVIYDHTNSVILSGALSDVLPWYESYPNAYYSGGTLYSVSRVGDYWIAYDENVEATWTNPVPMSIAGTYLKVGGGDPVLVSFPVLTNTPISGAYGLTVTATHLSTTPAATIIAGAARGASAIIDAAGIAAAGGLTNGTIGASLPGLLVDGQGATWTGGGKTNVLTFDGTNFISTITP